MNKKILVGLFLAIFNINQMQPNLAGFGLRTVTDMFKFNVVPSKLATYGVPQAGFKGFVATTIACIGIDMMIRKTANTVLPKHIAQYIVEDIQEAKDQHEQDMLTLKNEHKQQLEQQQKQFQKDLNEAKFDAALTTTIVLGSILLAHTYKKPIINWFTKPSIKTIIKNATSVHLAVQELKKHDYNKSSFTQANIQPGKFTATELKQILANL